MNHWIQAVYDHGAFVPKSPCDLPEKTEVELFIRLPSLVPATIRDPDEKAAILKRIVERMRRHPLPADAPRYTRDELHERR
jgi:predicted DNA-binding antitoxin AbrB/MazE fold protein